MDIKVSLPQPKDITGQSIKSFLRQLELCVHHLQKSVEEMEKEAPLDENSYLIYRFPFLEKQYTVGNDEATVTSDNASDDMQEIEIEINNM